MQLLQDSLQIFSVLLYYCFTILKYKLFHHMLYIKMMYVTKLRHPSKKKLSSYRTFFLLIIVHNQEPINPTYTKVRNIAITICNL